MNPERFQQIEELYHAARSRSGDEREALLARADPELRRHIESLLAQREGGEFLERPAIQTAPTRLGDTTVTGLTVGACLGPYRIESKVGAGGMGEVFRAVDTRLGRAVAIKVVQTQFIERFEREARAISSLNHPYICTLYDIGPNYLVMELVEGETIAARLQSGPLPVKTALLYASQILAALAEAHGKGVVHRDLKPGNIMIAKSGVKVLDFGLAKSGRDETITASQVVMGTPAYMAPEQREGKPADARSDIYSFGCILFEMLTGARVIFQRRRIPSRRLQRIVSRCLEEDPGRRWQSAAELERELTGISTAGSRWNRYAGAAGSPSAVDSYSHRTPKLADKSTIVLADFANATGDPDFDSTLRHILTVELENSARLSLLPLTRVNQTLELMGRPANSKLTPDVAFEICERTASSAVVEASITSMGDMYVLSLRARNYRTGDILDQEQRSAAKKEDVFKALAQMSNRLRKRVGESLARVETEASLPDTVIKVTTSSLEAWRSYKAAWTAVLRGSKHTEAVSLARRAVEIDPRFAMGYAFMGRSYDALGEAELAAENIRKAYELRDRVSDQENFFITFNYYRQVPRNLELARQVLESWAQKYPEDLMPHGFFAGFTSPGSGRYEKAVEEGLKALEIDPNYSVGYGNVAFAYVNQDRLREAEALLRDASERKIESVEFSLVRYFIAFLKKDHTGMDVEVTQRRSKLQAQGSFEHQEALTLAYHGRLKDAARLSDSAVRLARQGGLRERSAQFAGARAVWSALYGIPEEGQRNAVAALSLYRGRDADYGPAFALALLRNSDEAGQIAVELDQRFPEDTSVQFSYLPALRGLEALNRGDPVTALEMTQAAAPYDLAVPGTAFWAGKSFFGALYPVYVRGLAYSRLGRFREAVTEFRKILDHPGIVLSDPVGPMARLQLARALSDSGDGPRSAAVYEDLLAIWKDADPDLPVFMQAKAERAKLRVRGAP